MITKNLKTSDTKCISKKTSPKESYKSHKITPISATENREDGIGWAAVMKISKGEIVSTEVLMKICKVFHCNVGDIVDFVETVDETE